MCYQDGKGHEGEIGRGDDHQWVSCFTLHPNKTYFLARYTRIDPAQELSRIRHSLSLVEAYIYPHHRASLPRRTTDVPSVITPKKELLEIDPKASSQGVVGTQTSGGFFAGPTSAVTHFLLVYFLDT